MKHFILCWLLFLCALAPTAFAQNSSSTEQSTVTFLSDHQSVSPGQSFWTALHVDMAPEWHIYWVNPGDSGLEMTLDWNLPEGMEAASIQWPSPERIEFSGLYNYGYHKEILLPVPVTVSEDATLGDTTLEVKASWLICKEICIPESATLSLPMTISETAEPSDYFRTIEETLYKLPQIHTGTSQYEIDGDKVTIRMGLNTDLQRLKEVWWYPLTDGIIANDSDQHWIAANQELNIRTKAGYNTSQEYMDGVLELKDLDGNILHLKSRATPVNATPAGLAEEPATSAPQPASESSAAEGSNDTKSVTHSLGFVTALIFAFLGGIILNAMPCVLPILSLKAMSLAKNSDKEASLIKRHGLAYTAGILVSFAIIAGLLIALQQAGNKIGWGFQLQEPVFVAILGYLLFTVGLNLSGFFTFPSFFAGVGSSFTKGEHLSASFCTGLLATLVATPCTAPFMATALGYALSQSAAIAMLIFLSLGLGLAFPYLLMCFVPAFRHIIPKPGAWMERFKQFLAFPLYASAAWMIWILSQQSGPIGLASALAGICLIAFALWLLPILKGRLWRILILLLLGYALFSTLDMQSKTHSAMPIEQEEGVIPFSTATIEQLRAQNKPVFVNATAAWCITCKVNEKVALKDSDVAQAFKDAGITTMIADWTNQDPAITDYLASFGRNGVPIYVYYPPNQAAPKVLPQLLTPGIIIDAVSPDSESS